MVPDYLVSNEAAYLHILPQLRRAVSPGGAYVGVGSEQNFTYIAKTRPKIAFIVDNRRENLLVHLLFKALFALSRTRQEFLSYLFSKPLDGRMDPHGDPSLPQLIAYFSGRDGDRLLFKKNLADILKKIETYHQTLSREDIDTIKTIYIAFFTEHFDLRSPACPTLYGLPVPTYREILLATGPDGICGHFLNSDDEFIFLKQKQAGNLILPITGDFSGTKTLQTIGAFLRDRGENVSTFYLSNVEYFLFKAEDLRLFDAFVRNIKDLPAHDHSVFIRAFVNTESYSHPESDGSYLLTTTIQWIHNFLNFYDEGVYRTYRDVGTLDYIKAEQLP